MLLAFESKNEYSNNETQGRYTFAAGGGRNHLVNLNHGVDRGTPVANFEAYVRTVTGRMPR